MSFTNQETMNAFLFLFLIHSESRYPGSELAQSDRRKISQFLLAATILCCTFSFSDKNQTKTSMCTKIGQIPGSQGLD